MLNYEPLIDLLEMTIIERCMETRMDMGLHPIPGITCEDEPCLGKCPYREVEP